MTARRQLQFSSLALVALLVLAVAAPPAQAALPLQQSCYPIVVNGSFETRDGWTLGGGPLPPQYVYSPTKSGSWAMQIRQRRPFAHDYSLFEHLPNTGDPSQCDQR